MPPKREKVAVMLSPEQAVAIKEIEEIFHEQMDITQSGYLMINYAAVYTREKIDKLVKGKVFKSRAEVYRNPDVKESLDRLLLLATRLDGKLIKPDNLKDDIPWAKGVWEYAIKNATISRD